MENKNESVYESNNAYFKYWNKLIKEDRDRLYYNELPVNVYKKFSSFDYSKYVKIEDPLKVTEEKIKDLETGKVDKIFINLSKTFFDLFQLFDGKEHLIEKDPVKLNCDLDEYDYFFFGDSFKENKNIYMGHFDVIQHQEVSVQWFIKVLKQKKLREENGDWCEEDHSITARGYGGFLNWEYEMVPRAEYIGLNAGGVFSDEEIGLVRHGVSLSYENRFDISAAVISGCDIGGDYEDDVYFKYK